MSIADTHGHAKAAPTPKSAPSIGDRSRPSLNTCFRVHAPYGISIGSDVLARLAVVSNSPRDLGDGIASNLTSVSALVL